MRGIALVCALTFTTAILWPVPLRALFFSPLQVGDWLLCAFLVALSLFAYQNRDLLKHTWSSVLLGVALGTSLVFGLNLIRLMRWNVNLPPEWDFYLFWVFGRAARLGLNPYDQANLLRVAAPLNPSQELLRELFFFHSPPTLFLFLPLGWFDIQKAYFVWYCMNGIVLLVDLLLMWKLFLSDAGANAALFILAMVVLLRSAFLTVAFGQTNFIVLLLVLLFWRDWKSARGGIWLALGIAVKPLFVFLLLFPALRRQWRVLGAAAAAGGMLLVLSALAFGPAMVLTYFTRNPLLNDLPVYLYTENMNQSLLATTLRLAHFDPAIGSPYANPFFWVTCIVLIGITCWLTWHLKENDAPWGLSLTVILALLIFPKTLEHYALLLIVPMTMLWSQRELLPGRTIAIAAVITVVYSLINARGAMVFVAMALAWIVVASVGWMKSTRNADTLLSPQPIT